MPSFDAVGIPPPVESFEYVDDGIVDPGLAPVRLGFGAAAYDLIEGAVHGDVVTVGADGAGKAAWHMEFLQRKNPAFVRPHPKHFFGGAAFGHRKYAEPIGEQQFFGIDRCHAKDRTRFCSASRLQGPGPTAAM
jgi:hypothetical protein